MTRSIDKTILFRKKWMNSFTHGGDSEEFAQKIGCDIDEVIDLSSNINFVRPSIDIDFNRLSISAYPSYTKLYSAIAKRYGVDQESVELFNGGSSAIFSLFRFLNLESCTLYSPAYLEYKKSALLTGCSIDYIDRFSNLDKPVEANSFVIFVNPATPDGKYYNIDSLIKEWIAKECTVLIDESFLDFTPFESAIRYLEAYDKLYILKSMTKFYGSAGIRIGTLLSQSQNISAIKLREPLWKISQFDSAYIMASLRDKTFATRSQEENSKSKEKLLLLLQKSPLIKKIYPSDANFILVQLNNITAQEFQNLLIPFKIMIRDCSNFDGLDSSFARIAIKDMASIETLGDFLCRFQ